MSYFKVKSIKKLENGEYSEYRLLGANNNVRPLQWRYVYLSPEKLTESMRNWEVHLQGRAIDQYNKHHTETVDEVMKPYGEVVLSLVEKLGWN